MSEEVLLNVTPRETRIAMVENGVLTEVFIERASRLGLVGNIYKGKISRVLPGMQAAFVDIGLERTAFLHASDIHVPNNGTEEGRYTEDISKLVHQGQSLLVQVIKDPIGSKGARLCTQLSIAARYLVLMPALQHIGVSQKIEDEDDRNRLKRLTSELALEFGQDGYIIRTVAENATEKELKADMQFLQKLWNDIQEKSKTQADGTLVHEDLRLIMRTMRDQVGSGEGVEKIRIDSKENYEKIVKFANKFIPEVVSRIEYYPGKRPIFDLYGVEDEIQKALERKVELKFGGYLIID